MNVGRPVITEVKLRGWYLKERLVMGVNQDSAQREGIWPNGAMFNGWYSVACGEENGDWHDCSVLKMCLPPLGLVAKGMPQGKTVWKLAVRGRAMGRATLAQVGQAHCDSLARRRKGNSGRGYNAKGRSSLGVCYYPLP